MSCNQEVQCEHQRRGILGWLLLVPIVCLLAVYAEVAIVATHPNVDEAYRRTFLTSEFSVYPASDSWKPDDGLDYPVGTYVDFHRSDMRNWLSRLDWHRVNTPNVTLRGTSGRLFLHLVGEADPVQHRHRLIVWLDCHLSLRHAGEAQVSVNGRAVGSADCGESAMRIEADLPPGSLGAVRYDQIDVARTEGSVIERIATRLGLRAQAVELVGIEVDGG
jgi:hypothetical protein